MSTVDQTSSYDNLYDDDEEYTVTPHNQSRAKRASQVLVLLLVIGLSFWGGQFAQKHWGKSTTAATGARTGAFGARTGTGTGTAARTGTSAATGTGTGAAAPTGAAGGFTAGGFGGGTSGTVTLVDGTNIYVTETDGNVVKISTASASTTFDKTDTGSISDVKPGSTVTVRGTTGTDGTVAASTVTIGSTTTTRAAG